MNTDLTDFTDLHEVFMEKLQYRITCYEQIFLPLISRIFAEFLVQFVLISEIRG